MPAQVFRRRVNDQVNPVGERALVDRGAEGGINHGLDLAPPTDLSEPRQIENPQVGVGRRF